MTRRAHSDNWRTGTTVFQTSDRSLTYLESLLECRDVEFTELDEAPHASDFDLEKILNQFLGGTLG
jgi:hypothetical protein